jgi:hypothetical protein
MTSGPVIDAMLALLYVLPVVVIFIIAAAIADFIDYLRRR